MGLCNKHKAQETEEDTKEAIKTKLDEEKDFKMKFSNESLCSFLNSSVNIEYVYLILTGI